MTSRLCAVLGVLCAAPAAAVPFDMDEVSPHGRPYRPPFQCPPNQSWDKLRRCLATKDKVMMLRDLPDAKLVKLEGKATQSPTIFLYIRVSGTWQRTGFYGDTNPVSELLSFAPIGNAYQIDMGYVYPTSVTLDSVSVMPAMLRRKVTSVCSGQGACYSVTTSCELTVHGKAYWWFRGKPVWDGSQLRVTGDAANAGTYCQVPANLLVPVKS